MGGGIRQGPKDDDDHCNYIYLVHPSGSSWVVIALSFVSIGRLSSMSQCFYQRGGTLGIEELMHSGLAPVVHAFETTCLT